MLLQYLRFNSPVMPYLLSYLAQHGSGRWSHRELGQPSEVEVGPDCYLLFSIRYYKELASFHRTMVQLREAGPVPPLIVGGTLVASLDAEELRAAYPEIVYLVVGKGEEVLLNLVEHRPPAGVYQAEAHPRIRPYQLDIERFRDLGSAMVTFRQSCRWRRCRFCHHEGSVYERSQRWTGASDLVRLLEHGVDRFLVYDNDLDLRHFCEVLHGVRERVGDVEAVFGTLGTRILRAAEVPRTIEQLEAVRSRWPRLRINELNFGVEFDEQEVLDLYDKGIRLRDIDTTLDGLLDAFPDIGIGVYLLAGLPRVTQRQIDASAEFDQRFGPRLARHGPEQIRLSNFLLSPHVDVYRDAEQFQIRIGEPYGVNDFRHVDGLPDIRTQYLRFEAFDDDLGRYATRRETFRKYHHPLYRNLAYQDLLKPEHQ